MSCADCCDCAAKTVLIIINIIFMLLAFTFLLVGILLTAAWSLIEAQILPLLGSVLESSSSSPDAVTTDVTAGDILAVVGYVFIGLGGFMFVITVLGCTGACCKLRTPLIVYTVLIGLMLLAKLVFLILLITSVLDATFKTYLQQVIDNDYRGVADISLASFSLNLVMVQYKCCGIDSYKDFDTAKSWDKSYDTPLNGSVSLALPVVCCKSTGNFPNIKLTDEDCLTDPSNENSNWKTGCWDAIREEINTMKVIVLGAYSGVLAVELVCALVAIVLIRRTIKDEKAGKINPMVD